MSTYDSLLFFSVLAALIYILDTIALVTALCVIPMFPNGNPNRIILVICLVIGGFIFFGALSKFGEKYLNYNKGKENVTNNSTTISDVSSSKDGRGIQIDSNLADDDNLRKMSLGARAARKV